MLYTTDDHSNTSNNMLAMHQVWVYININISDYWCYFEHLSLNSFPALDHSRSTSTIYLCELYKQDFLSLSLSKI
jgi:hypothetical protein